MKSPLEVAAAKFMRAADALLNATERIRRYTPGSKGYLKAYPAWEVANATYDVARAELQALLDREVE